MNRRSFLKSIAGFSLAAVATQLSIPISAKCKIVAPVTEMVGRSFLDQRIKNDIAKLKRDKPYLKIGETHCILNATFVEDHSIKV